MTLSIKEQCRIAAGAARHESQRRFGHLPRCFDEAWGVLDELSRAEPDLTASRFLTEHGGKRYWQGEFWREVRRHPAYGRRAGR